MKSFLVLSTISALLVSGISANCNCDAWDSNCNNKCVVDTNHCITNCGGNEECYNQCIADHWPGQNNGHHHSRTEHHTSTYVPTSTAPWTSPLPTWTETNGPAVTTWYPSHTSGFPANPTHNGSSNLKATGVTVGMAIAAIAYLLQ